MSSGVMLWYGDVWCRRGYAWPSSGSAPHRRAVFGWGVVESGWVRVELCAVSSSSGMALCGLRSKGSAGCVRQRQSKVLVGGGIATHC